MHLKTKSILALISIGFLGHGWSQSKIKEIVQPQGTTHFRSQAERDWIELDTMKVYFCASGEELAKYNNSTFLEKRRFEDNVEKRRLKLAEAFLDKYPENTHYFDVLKFYFHPFFEPKFIASHIPDSLVAFLSEGSKLMKNHRQTFLKQMRALPLDIGARSQWLEKGNELATTYLESDATVEQKAKIERLLFGRDLRIAIYLYEFMDVHKEEMEAQYWERFDSYYWEPFLKRLETLLYKYPDLEVMASFVQQFITVVTSNYLSPELAAPYWDYLCKMTDRFRPLVNHKGIKAVQTMANENKKALEALYDFNGDKPLEMTFTALDGSQVSLESLRGKVVLIDFWSIRCGPCIKEMPHIRALYDKYKTSGFEVIGIVADDDTKKEQVLEIIHKQKATWPQRLDKGVNAKVSFHDLYSITSLPTVWLLNKEGQVVDKNARGLRLEPLIRKYLGLE